jgi:hypothetical protein
VETVLQTPCRWTTLQVGALGESQPSKGLPYIIMHEHVVHVSMQVLLPPCPPPRYHHLHAGSYPVGTDMQAVQPNNLRRHISFPLSWVYIKDQLSR